MPGGRPQKHLLDHVLEGTYRARENGRMLAAASNTLPVRPPYAGPSPAMVRLWARLRSLQEEYRDAGSAEIRHDAALEFGRTVTEYLEAAQSARRDPTKELDGLAELLAVNRRARKAA